MENELRSNLIACFDAFTAATGRKVQGVSQVAAGDWRFYSRLSGEANTFTVKKYDEVVAWFAANWPDGHAKPEVLSRVEVAQ